MFKRITHHASVEDDETMDDATSVQRYQQAADDFIASGVWGPRPEITEAPTSPSDDPITTRAISVTPSIPAGPSKGKKPATRRSTPVPPLLPTARMQAHIDQLVAEKEAALAELAKIKSQQTTTNQFLQRTVADVQNTPSAATAQHVQLSGDTATALNEIYKLIQRGQQANADEFTRISHNQNFLYEESQRHHTVYTEEFRKIKPRLHQLEVRGPLPQHQQEPSTQTTGTGFIPPPPPPPEAPVPPPRSPTPERVGRHYDDDDIISGKAPLPTKFNVNRDALEGWVLQLEEYFIITSVRNERQKMAFIGLCLEGEALDWWKANKNKYETWQEARDGMALYYGDQISQTDHIKNY